MEHGYYPAMPEADYRALDAVCQTDLKEFAKCPERYRWLMNNKPDQTPAMLIGAATHAYILQPEVWPDSYAVVPEIDRRTKQGKEDWAAFERLADGKQVIKKSDYESCKAMRQSCLAHREAAGLLGVGRKEVSMVWGYYELALKGRIDIDCGQTVVDLKTTEDASPVGFARSIAKFGYHIQAAFYIDGLMAVHKQPTPSFKFIAVEKNPPHLVAVYELSERAIQQGRAEYMAALESYRQCVKTGVWPGYDGGEIDLPYWARVDDEDSGDSPQVFITKRRA